MPGFVEAAERKLSGWPDTALTVGLLTMALLAVVTALTAPRTAKLGLLAWLVAP